MSEEKNTGRRALGRGIEALIPQTDQHGKPAMAGEGRKWVEMRAIEDLEPGKFQPRRNFDAGSLQGLVQSIREKGVVFPLLVRRKGRMFEIVAGERRWRAAQAAGFREVPVIVMDGSDQDALEAAIIENVQREDLNPIETAGAYSDLMTKFNLTQEAVAAKVGKDRSTIANLVRLLELPEKVKEALTSGDITAGHARALLSLESDAERLRMLRRILEKKLTVRQVEQAVRGGTRKPVPLKAHSTQLKAVADDLQRRYRTKVRIIDRGRGGTITFEYYSFEELDRLVQSLLGR